MRVKDILTKADGQKEASLDNTCDRCSFVLSMSNITQFCSTMGECKKMCVKPYLISNTSFIL